MALPLVACALALAVPARAGPDARDMPAAPSPRMPDLPPAQLDDTLAIGGEDIAARKLRTRMTVAVEVNDTGPHRFVVDSGADTSVVGTRLAAALALPPRGSRMLNGITESKVVPLAAVASLRVGPTEVADLALPVLREQDLGADGMLGLDALVEQRLMLDFENRTIAVEDGASKAPRLDGEIVVRARLQKGQLILTEVGVERKRVDAIVDTGSEITIANTALRDQLLRRSKSEIEKIRVFGVTGAAANLDLVVVKELRLGPVVLRDVPIAFADVPPFGVFGLDRKPALLLGTDLMELFRRVSLDFRARKVRFQLRRCLETVFVSTSSSASRLSSESDAACRK